MADNALKYGKDDVSINLFRQIKKKEIICEIFDKSNGVDSRVLNNLFEPFYRIDKSRNSEVYGS